MLQRVVTLQALRMTHPWYKSHTSLRMTHPWYKSHTSLGDLMNVLGPPCMEYILQVVSLMFVRAMIQICNS